MTRQRAARIRNPQSAIYKLNLQLWQRVKEVFEAARRRAPEERARFLDEACGDDDELRREVESLLASFADAENFMEQPAVGEVAEMIAGESRALAAGQRLSHYEIIRAIGAGGMGEVYLARDTSLRRSVALKLLPTKFAGEPDRLRRFEQEAEAVSALNHPNILTIYEVGRTDAAHFIATEFVDGVTLRQRIGDGPMKIGEVLDVGVQVADALAAAHDAGILHRDIKPENIMVRRDGYVKVLDFGIAKFTAPQPSPVGTETDDEAATKQLFKTATGMVMGTANYMSPEQARGLALDARTDVWSLGVVLYEMCAGRAPFRGATPSDVLVSILTAEPPALTGGAEEAPAEFQRIVTKALRKDREDRYESVREMALDLKSLKRRLEYEPEPARSAPPNDEPRPPARTEPVASETITQVSSATRVADGTRESNAPPSRKRLLILAPVVALILLVAGIFIFRGGPPPPAAVVTPAPPPPPAAAPPPRRALSYSLTVQKYRAGKPYQQPFQLGREIVFERDYRIRLNVRAAQEGYLYVLNERPAAGGATASFNVLFPSPTANDGSARVAANQELQIPRQSWFQFDAEEGTELVWLVWAAEKQPALEAVKELANPKDKGAISDPARAKAVKEFLKTHSVSKPAAERDDARRETSVSVAGDVFAHVIKLEHH